MGSNSAARADWPCRLGNWLSRRRPERRERYLSVRRFPQLASNIISSAQPVLPAARFKRQNACTFSRINLAGASLVGSTSRKTIVSVPSPLFVGPLAVTRGSHVTRLLDTSAMQVMPILPIGQLDDLCSPTGRPVGLVGLVRRCQTYSGSPNSTPVPGPSTLSPRETIYRDIGYGRGSHTRDLDRRRRKDRDQRVASHHPRRIRLRQANARASLNSRSARPQTFGHSEGDR